MAFIFALSSLSRTPALPQGADKQLHALLYCGLGVLLTRALAGGLGERVSVRTACVVTLLAGLYGVSDEVHQWFVPPRQVEVLDVVADTVGGAMAGFGLYAWGIIQARHGL